MGEGATGRAAAERAALGDFHPQHEEGKAWALKTTLGWVMEPHACKVL